MFYVSNNKVYLAEYDKDTRVYPEVLLKRTADGGVAVVRTSGGAAKKPRNRSVCTLQELIAQGGLVAPYVPYIPMPEDTEE